MQLHTKVHCNGEILRLRKGAPPHTAKELPKQGGQALQVCHTTILPKLGG